MAATWAFFDLNGTLVDPSVLAEPLGGASEAPLVHAAFTDAVQLAMVTTLTGGRAGFRDLLGAALRRRLALDGRDPGLAEAALRLLRAMPPFPEASAALARLRHGGVRVGVLTQSSAEAAEAVLRFGRLRDALDIVVSADDAGAFKPHPRPYELALARTGATAGQAWMVAAHWWDVAGAKRAGLRTAWIARRERVLMEQVPEPDVRAADLAEAAAGILARP